MKKIIILLAILSVCVLAFSSDLTGGSPSTTYKKLFSLDADSLTSTVGAVTDGVGTAMPFSIGTTKFRLGTTNKIELYGENNYLHGTDANNVTLLAGTDLSLLATKLYLRTTSNYLDSNNDLTLAGDLNCVDITPSGTVNLTGSGTSLDVDYNANVDGTLTVDGVSTLTGAVTASGGVTGDVTGNVTGDVTGDLTGDVTSTGTSAFAVVTASSTVDVAGAITGTSTLEITGTSTLTGAVTATGGIKTDEITEITGDNGVVIETVTLVDGDIQLNNDNYISFDTDDNSQIYSDADNTINVNLNSATDFVFTANTLTASSGSSILTNTLNETTTKEGVTIDGFKIEQKDNIISMIPYDGKYTAFVSSDTTSNPTSHSITAREDVYIEGLLEVDGKTWLDGALQVAGTTTVAGLSFSGTDPTISPSDNDANAGDAFYVAGGDGGATGGDLYLDGGDGTADGDIVIGKTDGNLSINSPVLYAGYATLTCDGGGVAATITEPINYINITVNDTITVADGVEGQTISFVTYANTTTFDAHIQPANCGWGTETVLDSKTSACELIFHSTKWYIKSITD